MIHPKQEDIDRVIAMIKEQFKDKLDVAVFEDIYSINDEEGHHWLKIVKIYSTINITDTVIMNKLDENPEIAKFLIEKHINLHIELDPIYEI